MIPYKLAKELKDAGFPQKIGLWEGFWYSMKGQRIEEAHQIVFDKCVYSPTLSELIDACGDKISHIKRLENGVWFAVSHNAFYKDGVNNIEEDGLTPEEAVAKLYLKLNK